MTEEEESHSTSSSSSSSSCDEDDIDDDVAWNDNDEEARVPDTATVDSPAAALVQQWVHAMPVGLGLCPWAIKAQRTGRIVYTTAATIEPVAVTVRQQAQVLLTRPDDEPWHTTLLVLPHLTQWKDNFEAFDTLVTQLDEEMQQQGVTLVAFHPAFLRWRGLPNGVGVGSVVHAYRRVVCPTTGRWIKSETTHLAQILQTVTRPFGQRRIRVRYLDNDNSKTTTTTFARSEQYISMDWCEFFGNNNNNNNNDASTRPPLCDNAMHRAPCATIHLIRQVDLQRLTARSVSRVKRINAQRTSRLGWQGLAAIWENTSLEEIAS